MRKLLLWILFALSALALFISLTLWLLPRPLSIEQAGGIEYVYQLDTKTLPATANLEEFANRAIDVLRRRAGPDHQIAWRVVNHKDIQLQILFTRPATPESREARHDALAAEESAYTALQAACWDTPSLQAIFRLNPAQRDAAIARLTARGSPEEKALRDLAAAADALQKATADLEASKPGDAAEAALLAARAQCRQNFDALADALPASINPSLVRELASAADDDPAAALELDKIKANPWPQKNQLEAYLKAHQQARDVADPGEIDALRVTRLITRAGILDFRIAVLPNEIEPVEKDQAVRTLKQEGPLAKIKVGGVNARWFLIDRNAVAGLVNPGYVTAVLDDQHYILCYDSHDRTLTHSDPMRDPWSLTANSPYTDPIEGYLLLPFNMDPKGAGYLGDLTARWKQHPLTILLDDKAMSAPNIQAQITDKGTISFGKGRAAASVLKEAQQLKAVMDAGALPVVVLPIPLSVRELAPIPGYHPFPWYALSTFLSLLLMPASLWLALQKPPRHRAPPSPP